MRLSAKRVDGVALVTRFVELAFIVLCSSTLYWRVPGQRSVARLLSERCNPSRDKLCRTETVVHLHAIARYFTCRANILGCSWVLPHYCSYRKR